MNTGLLLEIFTQTCSGQYKTETGMLTILLSVQIFFPHHLISFLIFFSNYFLFQKIFLFHNVEYQKKKKKRYLQLQLSMRSSPSHFILDLSRKQQQCMSLPPCPFCAIALHMLRKFLPQKSGYVIDLWYNRFKF